MKILRIDDVGASSKHFNQHGRKVFRFKGVPFFYFPLANFWFFKRVWPFKRWGVYDELSTSEWNKYLQLFDKYQIVPIVAVTACWVEKNGVFVPFYLKFPDEAEVLKKAVKNGKITIANHGLTHCVVGNHLPKIWSRNNDNHREFWPYLSQSWHNEHISRSQEILEGYFGVPVEILVPPGNIWSYKTYLAVLNTNIKKIICGRYMADGEKKMDGIEFVDDKENFLLLHDRDLKLKDEDWLTKQLLSFK
ncbi:MAG: hypothetical protein A2538_04700 [Candidatus Magasanikbacteria bacterium RIFOXYD2_FULL_41_14]|uniref:NodB homology domain-containing protein n=1 Tax=Candidatus Magasanikbacteria bacterium RIFOXYD2_FULL_41_14 TaxID=1798709 RepID=A0A1F6PFP0_9BACT|nr:MAG: hypothetical protein A2538_04700 [Candidatus Magasanikbacteria bacterium RIFOXYD2_FULL_41_14]